MWPKPSLALALLLALLLVFAVVSQALFTVPEYVNIWNQPNPELPSPPVRSMHASTELIGVPLLNRIESVAGVSDMILIFSGLRCTESGNLVCTFFNDTWVYELATFRWVQIVSTTPPPPPRSSATLTALPSGNAADPHIILIGGITTGLIPLNDVWQLSLPKKAWTQLVPLNSGIFPPLFGHSALAWNGTILVYGGCLQPINFVGLAPGLCQFYSFGSSPVSTALYQLSVSSATTTTTTTTATTTTTTTTTTSTSTPLSTTFTTVASTSTAAITTTTSTTTLPTTTITSTTTTTTTSSSSSSSSSSSTTTTITTTTTTTTTNSTGQVVVTWAFVSYGQLDTSQHAAVFTPDPPTMTIVGVMWSGGQTGSQQFFLTTMQWGFMQGCSILLSSNSMVRAFGAANNVFIVTRSSENPDSALQVMLLSGYEAVPITPPSWWGTQAVPPWQQTFPAGFSLSAFGSDAFLFGQLKNASLSGYIGLYRLSLISQLSSLTNGSVGVTSPSAQTATGNSCNASSTLSSNTVNGACINAIWTPQFVTAQPVSSSLAIIHPLPDNSILVLHGCPFPLGTTAYMTAFRLVPGALSSPNATGSSNSSSSGSGSGSSGSSSGSSSSNSGSSSTAWATLDSLQQPPGNRYVAAYTSINASSVVIYGGLPCVTAGSDTISVDTSPDSNYVFSDMWVASVDVYQTQEPVHIVWRQICVDQFNFPSLSEPRMVLDEESGGSRVVLFGTYVTWQAAPTGFTVDMQYLLGIELNVVTCAWKVLFNVSQSSAPTAASNPLFSVGASANVFKGSNGQRHVVLFGGFNGQYVAVNTTRVFTLPDGPWKVISYPASAVYPAPRGLHSSLVVGQHLAIFGGSYSIIPQVKTGELWALDLERYTWILLAPDRPYIRRNRAAITVLGPLSSFGQQNSTSTSNSSSSNSSSSINSGGSSGGGNSSSSSSEAAFLAAVSKSLLVVHGGLPDSQDQNSEQAYTDVLLLKPGCLRGTEAAIFALDPCMPCRQGTYSPGPGLPCVRCPGSSSTKGVGSMSDASCSVCAPGVCHYGTCRLVQNFDYVCDCNMGYSSFDDCRWPYPAILGTFAALIGAVMAFFLARRIKRRFRSYQAYNKLQERLLRDHTEEILELKRAWHIDYAELTLKRKLDEGGFGEVWLGYYQEKEVAIKLVKESMVEYSGDVSEEFDREIAFMRTLRHPNVVFFYGAGHRLGTPFIVTEFCSKGSLRRLLEHSDFSQTQKIQFAVDASCGMAFLHSMSRIHCDVKSGNFLVTASFAVKVADFGTSQVLKRLQTDSDKAPAPATKISIDENIPLEQTQIALHGFVGTLLWTAPEVLRGENYDLKIDVYSFGVVLWEIYFQNIPYEDLKTRWDVERAVLGGKRPPVPAASEVPDSVWQQYFAVMQDCWQDRPQSRPTFKQVHQQLLALRQSMVMASGESLVTLPSLPLSEPTPLLSSSQV